jgi:uncharacterized membrane protein
MAAAIAVSSNPLGGAAPAGTGRGSRARVDGIDLLRGIIMVIMVLDHVRDFSFAGTFLFDPTDLSQTTPAIFFTRWITHFCATGFVFLAGTGAYLRRTRGASIPDLSRFLWTRGLWLVVLEFTVVRVGISLSFDYHRLGIAQVLWVIGVSMIVMAVLIRLPTRIIGGVGIAMILLHNLLDRFPVYRWSPGSPYPSLGQILWGFAHAQFQAIPLGRPFPVVVAAYALVPWTGVMAAGYAFGSIYELDAATRRRILIGLGSALCAAFVVVRALNTYGDPAPWAVQPTAMFTVLSFLRVTKYPPSLDFLLMGLGPSMLALAWFERIRPNPVSDALITFGRVPLFFYLMQWYVAHLLTLGAVLLVHGQAGWLFWRAPRARLVPDGGFRLRTTYMIWIASVALMYPACRWFARIKATHRTWWLSYL